jgi:hypothetical protein
MLAGPVVGLAAFCWLGSVPAAEGENGARPRQEALAMGTGQQVVHAVRQKGLEDPTAPEKEAPAVSPSMLYLGTMSPEGAAIGNELSHLEGEEFEHAYHAHAEAIRKAQDLARRLALEGRR